MIHSDFQVALVLANIYLFPSHRYPYTHIIIDNVILIKTTTTEPILSGVNCFIKTMVMTCNKTSPLEMSLQCLLQHNVSGDDSFDTNGWEKCGAFKLIIDLMWANTQKASQLYSHPFELFYNKIPRDCRPCKCKAFTIGGRCTQHTFLMNCNKILMDVEQIPLAAFSNYRDGIDEWAS